MRSALCLIVIMGSVPALSAAGFDRLEAIGPERHWQSLENILRTASFEITAIDVAAAAPVPAAVSPLYADSKSGAGFIFKGTFCWQRGKDPDAERMEMPFSFCVNSMEISGGLFDKPRIAISGNFVDGVFDLKVGPPADGFYKSTAIIFRKGAGTSCSEGEDAYIELSVLADARGKIATDPFIKAFYGRASGLCNAQWEYSAVKYVSTGI